MIVAALLCLDVNPSSRHGGISSGRKTARRQRRASDGSITERPVAAAGDALGEEATFLRGGRHGGDQGRAGADVRDDADDDEERDCENVAP